MKLCTSTNTLYERADGSRIPAAESIRLCAEAGYEELDFCFVDQIFGKTAFIGKDWEPLMRSFREQAEALHIRFTQSHGPLYGFCSGRDEQTEEWIHRSLLGSHILGVRWMVMHPDTLVSGDSVDARTMALNADFFRRLSDEAGRYGIGVAIENMWGKNREGVPRFAVDPAELAELIDRVDAENVGACWDAEHGSIEKLHQGAAIRLLGNRLKALHISDQTAADNIHILPYMGITGWDQVLSALADIGYDNSFTFEIQHYLLYLPMELVPSAIRFSQEVGNHMIRRIEDFRNRRQPPVEG